MNAYSSIDFRLIYDLDLLCSHRGTKNPTQKIKTHFIRPRDGDLKYTGTRTGQLCCPWLSMLRIFPQVRVDPDHLARLGVRNELCRLLYVYFVNFFGAWNCAQISADLEYFSISEQLERNSAMYFKWSSGSFLATETMTNRNED